MAIPFPWIPCAVAYGLALVANAWGMLADLGPAWATNAWPAGHVARRVWSGCLWLAAWPISMLVLARHLRGRTPSPAQAQSTVDTHQLVRLPMAVGVRFALWSGLCGLAMALVLREHLGLNIVTTLAWAGCWLGSAFLLTLCIGPVLTRDLAASQEPSSDAPAPARANLRREYGWGLSALVAFLAVTLLGISVSLVALCTRARRR